MLPKGTWKQVITTKIPMYDEKGKIVGTMGITRDMIAYANLENSHSLIKDIKFPGMLSQTVYQHHERLDGSGYPRGLKADEITLEAKVLGVSDVLESMTSHRPYRAALGLDMALAELKKGSGIKYDPDIVRLVKGMVKENKGKEFWLN